MTSRMSQTGGGIGIGEREEKTSRAREEPRTRRTKGACDQNGRFLQE